MDAISQGQFSTGGLWEIGLVTFGAGIIGLLVFPFTESDKPGS